MMRSDIGACDEAKGSSVIKLPADATNSSITSLILQNRVSAVRLSNAEKRNDKVNPQRVRSK